MLDRIQEQPKNHHLSSITRLSVCPAAQLLIPWKGAAANSSPHLCQCIRVSYRWMKDLPHPLPSLPMFTWHSGAVNYFVPLNELLLTSLLPHMTILTHNDIFYCLFSLIREGKDAVLFYFFSSRGFFSAAAMLDSSVFHTAALFFFFLTEEVYSVRCAKVEKKMCWQQRLLSKTLPSLRRRPRPQFSTMYYLMLSFTHILVRGVSGGSENCFFSLFVQCQGWNVCLRDSV